jgi:hypothetical protein
MQTRAASVVLAVLYLAGCAATTPAPRFSAVSPADAEAPEAATPLPAPALMSDEDAKGPLPAGDAAKPAAGHEGHSMPAGPAQADEEYSCPMHPEVTQGSPGTCPKCGMPLVRRKGARPQP